MSLRTPSFHFVFTLRTQKTSIDPYEIFTVGKDLLRLPLANVILKEAEVEGDNDTLDGKIFFEFNKEQLNFTNQVKVDIYTNVGDGDCGGGTVIDKEAYKYKIFPFNYNKNYEPRRQNECYPQSKDGRVVTVDFSIKDLETVQTPDGSFDICVRVGYKIQINEKEVDISFVDTKIKGTIDLSGGFSTFNLGVSNVQIKDTDFEQDVQKIVKIERGFGRNQNNEFVTNPDKTYGVGQNFRICVGSEEAEYEVDNFVEVSCGSRDLVLDSKAVNDLTVIDTELKMGRITVESVLTVDLVAKGQGTGSVPCRGTVSLKKKRNFRGASDEAEELFKSSFEMNINFDTPINNKNIESSAPLPTLTTTTVVAVIGVGSILFFVFSFFLYRQHVGMVHTPKITERIIVAGVPSLFQKEGAI